MNKIGKSIILIDVSDWDKLVVDTYGRPYNFQQQDGCQPRGIVELTVPSEYADEVEMNDSIPEEVNGSLMGVTFDAWLKRDPKQPLFFDGKYETEEWMIEMFWERNFYPNLYVVANDLHKRGLLEAGEYTINIDW